MLPTLQDKKRRAIDKFGEGCTWEEAATAAGVSRMTLWRWSQADPEFAKAIEDAKSGPDAEVEAVTFANATDPDPAHNTLRMFWLKSRMPQRYKDRVDITSDDRPFGYFERVENPREAGIPSPAETA